jgi:light-regulated signal transduction histidine kinase (bacteriophytochrome)
MDQANGDSMQPVAQRRSLFSNPAFSIWQFLLAVSSAAPALSGWLPIQRIVHPQGGKAWAEGVVDEGATFYFSVSNSRE